MSDRFFSSRPGVSRHTLGVLVHDLEKEAVRMDTVAKLRPTPENLEARDVTEHLRDVLEEILNPPKAQAIDQEEVLPETSSIPTARGG